ncbi:MAG: endonuclease domain-containing protein [Clostridia bacterium]|nr:endonuclease domain-containing protein [Clostridia bacterium]
MKDYKKEYIPLANKLRREATPWERKLWYEYLCHHPVRFQRQKVIGEYIVDFYAAKARLVIELDGGGHFTPEEENHDTLRTAYLESVGLRVIRISNSDIDRHFETVCDYIDQAAKDGLSR